MDTETLQPISSKNLQELAKAELAKRELASRHLKWYIRYTEPNFVFEAFHKQLLDALEAVERGELKRLMVFLPPRTGKSKIISELFPTWCLGRDPKKEAVCVSYGADLANTFGRRARNRVISQDFKNIFPECKLSEEKRESGNWETTGGGGYYSVGVGGSITGRGFNIGIIDDPVKNREDAESEVFREKVWEWYTSTFLTRQQGTNSAIVILMTRWNTDDLAGRILEQEKGWKVITLPALNDKEEALVNRDGFGKEFYLTQRDAIGVRDFEALYQQDPIRSTGQTFKKENFRYFALSDIDPKDFTVGIHIDPAFSTRDSSDDTAIMVTAKHKITKEIYCLDALAEPLLPSQAYEYIISAADRWKQWGDLEYISVEEVAINPDQQEFFKGLDRKMRANGKFYTVLSFNPQGKGKKEDRIKFSLEPLFDRKVIHFRMDDTGNHSWTKLEEQLLKFPVSKRDDLMDALSQGVIMWEKRGEYDNHDSTLEMRNFLSME